MEQQAAVSQPRWEAKVSAGINNGSPDQIWRLFADFFGLHKWFPGLSTCYGVHGNNGEVGCVRYCAGFSLPSEGGEEVTSWSKERLVALDPNEKTLSYEMVDSNIGFTSYVSTIKIVSGDDGKKGCVIEWSFAVDPVEGLSLEDLVEKYETGLRLMAKKMEDLA